MIFIVVFIVFELELVKNIWLSGVGVSVVSCCVSVKVGGEFIWNVGE